MGNQAQQSQELELWQVVSSSGNVRGRQTRPRRSVTQSESEMRRRGNVSNYNKAMLGNARSAGVVRAGNAGSRRAGSPRTSGAVRAGNARPAGAVRAGNAGSRRAGSPRPAGAARAGNARPSGAVRARNARPMSAARPANARVRKKKQKQQMKPGRRARISQFLALAWIAAMCAAIFFMGKVFYQSMQEEPVVKASPSKETSNLDNLLPVVGDTEKKPQIREDFLTISEYNRPGTKLESVKNIFVHYTANPRTSAAQNRSYFENLGQTHERAASAHFIIGYEGEIVQCIPLEEEAYAVMGRNGDSISIECCYLEKDGSFTQETYDSLIEMLAWLIDQYDLEPQDILRHYDCGGKKCPLYYVEHEDAWRKLLDDVAHYTL